ncbi:hypothetical protein NU688_03155 [Variovorax sp. ZS18.2.2]|uniref:hypothetical protein n=1 Tax=Variovorax sp. ZS18.2.2 TaxID=2971255 RepID=UPI002151A12B|nr:hypothetical protein [Variovorax sp. ZS18.2.2]MCR6475144.1 hypothetical protein [Variovorax sp. ZS18.2.2]
MISATTFKPSLFFSRKLAPSLLAACSAVAGSASAESIGRTEFDPSGLPWIQLTQYESSLKFNGGEHRIAMETKVFYLAGPGPEPMAVLVLTSTEGGNRRSVDWVSETCPPARPKFHTEDFGTNQTARTRQCLVVNSAFATMSYLKPDSELVRAAAEKGIALFKSGYSIRSVYGANGGTLLRVNLMTNRKFAGLPQVKPQAEDRHEAPEPLVAWGEALQKNVEASVLSMSGRFVLPPVSF